MTIFIEKVKPQNWAISTETSDARIYIGNTLKDAVNAYKGDTGVNVTRVLQMVNGKYVEVE